MQLFAVPLSATYAGNRPCVVIGARDAETTVTFGIINENGEYAEADTRLIRFHRRNQFPHGFDLAPAFVIPTAEAT